VALIFLVEDNESIRESVASYLRLDDHEVMEFPRAAVEAARRRRPALCILDVMLPDGDGFQVARQLKRDGDVPILFLTARVAESDRITGFLIDAASHRAAVNGSAVTLTPAEWSILAYLADRPDTVVSRQRLLGECLGSIAEGAERVVDTHVKNIRSKLGNRAWIDTVRGYGYRFAGSAAPTRQRGPQPGGRGPQNRSSLSG
jgi:DNA-binding response OmpR family regulator